MREKGLYKTHTLNELIYELKKIKVIETNDNDKFLTEISKKQREFMNNSMFLYPIPEKKG